MLVSGSGVLPYTYIDHQVSGPAGGPGVYALQVFQSAMASTAPVLSSSGAACSRGAIVGKFFDAIPVSTSATAVTKSCVTGGQFNVGDTLSGAGVSAGTQITALDSAGHHADGLYVVNVNQAVASGAMTAHIDGFGTNAQTKFVIVRTAWFSKPEGVQTAQQMANDHQGLLPFATATVNTQDAQHATATDIHYKWSWIAELGRRLYLGYLGQCDYHSPTC
jgi:hypothetical protein